jgi:CRISPR-associated endoribonuclease Cas6
MRFKLTLKRTSKENQIPASYAYELHSALLKILNKADEQYADFIHNTGHQVPDSKKSFKLFCYSQLFIYPFHIEKGRITIRGNEVSLLLSFYVDKTAETFIMGLFKDQHFRLGNRDCQTAFQIENVEVIALPTFAETMTYKLHSPVFVSKKNPDGATDTYLSPKDADYVDFLKKSLLDKYLSVHSALPTEWQHTPFEIEILGGEQAKEKLITLKAGKDAETSVKGYQNFQIRITAPAELLELALLSGLGSKNSMGFGYVSEAG